MIGLADIGNQVLGENRQPLTDVLHLLVPTTDLTNEYNQALWCALGGMINASAPPAVERAGCRGAGRLPVGSGAVPLPDGPAQGRRERAVRSAPGCRTCRSKRSRHTSSPTPGPTRGGARTPASCSIPILIKQIMFGDTEIDGPPRNSAQIGQPG